MGVGGAVGASVAVGVAKGVAVGDEREPPPTARGEDAAPDLSEDVSLHAALNSAKTMQNADTAVRRSFKTPGALRGKNPTFTGCGQ